MTAKTMTIHISTTEELAYVSISMKGDGIRDYVRSGGWENEHNELTERLKSFNAMSGALIDDSVKLSMNIPRMQFTRGDSLPGIVESILQSVIKDSTAIVELSEA